MSAGRVSFVGAGPGAADLLTLRAAQRISEADIVIWAASLVHEDVLQHVRADAVVVNSAEHSLEGITAHYERAARRGAAGRAHPLRRPRAVGRHAGAVDAVPPARPARPR